MRQQTVVSGKGRPGSHGISRDYGGIRVRIQEMILQKMEAEYRSKASARANKKSERTAGGQGTDIKQKRNSARKPAEIRGVVLSVFSLYVDISHII